MANHRNPNGQKGGIDSVNMDHTSYSILSKVLPETDIVLEFVGMSPSVAVDVVSRCFLDIGWVCLLERYREEIGHYGVYAVEKLVFSRRLYSSANLSIPDFVQLSLFCIEREKLFKSYSDGR